MNNYCKKCGAQLSDNVKFCQDCGTPVEDVTKNILNSQIPTQTLPQSINIPPRGILIAVILSFVTCGIYSIYWFIKMTDESNELSTEKTTSGVLSLVYNLITCGIYGLYWQYKMGKKMYAAGLKYNKNIQDNSIVYLVLSIFGLGIVNYCLIQNDLNKFTYE